MYVQHKDRRRMTLCLSVPCLLLLSLSLNACGIISYSPGPSEFPLAAKRDGLIRFYFHTGTAHDPKATDNSLPPEAAILQETLERNAGFAAAILSTPPTPGLHVNAYITNKEPSPSSKFFCTLSFFTFTALPCYSDTEGLLVQYDILIDQQFKKSYRFPIAKTQVLWIGLIPVSWINAFTITRISAFEATIHEFIKAGQADGLLPTLPAEGQ